MILKRKPKKPVRKMVRDCRDITHCFDGELQDVIDELNSRVDNTALKQIISVNQHYDYVGVEIETQRMETDEEFEVRMVPYKQKLAEYEAWYKDNQAEIEAELDLRKNKKEYAKQKEIKKLQNKLDQLKAS